jgi:hypothetical protein
MEALLDGWWRAHKVRIGQENFPDTLAALWIALLVYDRRSTGRFHPMTIMGSLVEAPIAL